MYPTILIYVALSKQFPADNMRATLYPGDASTQLKSVICIGDGDANCLFQAFFNCFVWG